MLNHCLIFSDFQYYLSEYHNFYLDTVELYNVSMISGRYLLNWYFEDDQFDILTLLDLIKYILVFNLIKHKIGSV